GGGLELSRGADASGAVRTSTIRPVCPPKRPARRALGHFPRDFGRRLGCSYPSFDPTVCLLAARATTCTSNRRKHRWGRITARSPASRPRARDAPLVWELRGD